MTARTILQSFDAYRLARMNFVQTVAEMAYRPQNIDVLLGARVLDLLKPLLDDICPQIQQCAAIALGRIAHHSTVIGQTSMESGLLSSLLNRLETRNTHYRRAAMFVLRSVCRHGTQAAEAVVMAGSGAIEAIMLCLVDLDSQVREAAAWAAGYIARASPALAKAIADAGAVPQLVLCLQEPELSVRRVAASALSDIARHSHDLAVIVMNSSAIAHLAKAVLDRDDGLKRQALLSLSAIARQDVNAAESVVQAEIFPDSFVLMGHRCPKVRRNAAMLVRDVVRHTPELAQFVVNTGGVGALVEAIKDDELNMKNMCDEDDYRIPAVTAIGYISGHGLQLAMCVISCDGVTALVEALNSATIKSDLKSSCVWALGQIGRFCAEPITATGVLLQLSDLIQSPNASEELRSRCQATLRLCVQGCCTMSVLEPLLQKCSPDILKYVLGQIAKILPIDPLARRMFVTSGSLKYLQELEVEPGSQNMEFVTIINACFPDEVIRFYTPGYSDLLLQKVEEYKPNFEGGSDGVTFDHDCAPAPSRTASKELGVLFDD